MNSVNPSNKILIPFESDNKNPLFDGGCSDIDRLIVNLLVQDSLSGDLRNSNFALFNLSQIKRCALKCLGNPFFMELFKLQHPLLVEYNEFPLFSRIVPKVYGMILCHVLPTMHIYNDRSEWLAYEEGDTMDGQCSDGDDPTPESSFKFNPSFLELGCSILNEQKAPCSEGGTQLSCQECNSLLFSELGRAKFQEEILCSLSLLNQCIKVLADINNKHEVMTPEQENQILKLFNSCNWAIKSNVTERFASLCGDISIDTEDQDGWIADLFPQHLLEFQEAITTEINIITDPENDYYLSRLRPAKICLDAL